jgi:diaminohydroxyphosphoribosylaminopyrimidine deaminase/5-amino-6-(5-phosphoribosylamino)uracil reductase
MVTPVPDDRWFMTRALALAERGRGNTSPNPMVGAVVVTPEGVVAGAGFHERAGGAHAEVNALRAAGPAARGATLYCTLEPCCHTGRTGPCAPAIARAGIVRVVAAVEDADPRVSGRGFAMLREHGVDVTTGICETEAMRLNEAFFTFVRLRRPFTIMKVATSLDGRIAAAEGSRTPLTGKPANRRIQALRAEVDAIAIGSGTALVDDPLLTVRDLHRDRPLTRIIFDTRLRTPITNRIWSTLAQGAVIVMTTEAAVRQAPDRARALNGVGATLEALPERDLRTAMTRLADRGVTSLVIEGGAELHRAAWRAGIVDRVQVYVTPGSLGSQGVPWLRDTSLSIAALQSPSVESVGDDVLIQGDVYRRH